MIVAVTKSPSHRRTHIDIGIDRELQSLVGRSFTQLHSGFANIAKDRGQSNAIGGSSRVEQSSQRSRQASRRSHDFIGFGQEGGTIRRTRTIDSD